jgi:transposase
MMPGVIVADIARKHGTTRWQIYDWRKQIRKGNLVVPESVAALPMFAEIVVEDREPVVLTSGVNSGIEIVVGDVVIRAGTGADEGQLTRAIRAARLACWVMAVPQVVVICLLAFWDRPFHAAAILAVLALQLWAMRILLSDPKGRTPWYNGTGITLYVGGMMIAAFAIRTLEVLP